MSGHRSHGLILVETLAILISGAMLLFCCVAMIARQNNDARLVRSMANLRHLATMSVTYAADWNDRQMTLVVDGLSRFGKTPAEAMANYETIKGQRHAPIVLGSPTQPDMPITLSFNDPANHWALAPISFDGHPRGWFRLINAHQFSIYLNGRFYDPVYYAPKDEAVLKVVEPYFTQKGEFDWPASHKLYFSSYCMSPAALYSPDVLRRPKDGAQSGYQDPWSIPDGFKCPSVSQATYANLKTQLIEHQWLQNAPDAGARCIDKFDQPTYEDCEPLHFNHSILSSPLAVFYDGHIAQIAVKDVVAQDQQVRAQTRSEYGLWYPHPGDATDGYFEDSAADPVRTSFHIYTIDGIKGRDIVSAPAAAANPASRPAE